MENIYTEDDYIDRFLIFLSRKEPEKRLPSRNVAKDILVSINAFEKSLPEMSFDDIDELIITVSKMRVDRSIPSREFTQKILERMKSDENLS